VKIANLLPELAAIRQVIMEDRAMSRELDNRVDALRDKLIKTASTPVGMGNYKQQLRAYQEMFLELINITDEVNAMDQQVSPTVLDALRKHVADALAQRDEPEGET
jgi:hypothetical protein